MKTATTFLDYQQRATEFKVGDQVVPLGAQAEWAGRVVAVFPAIGMVDVEFSNGNKRYPVEDVQRLQPGQPVISPMTDSVPGGSGTVEVPNGPHEKLNVPSTPRPVVQVSDAEEAQILHDMATRTASHIRVAQAWVKRALYWNGADRKYRATQSELDGKVYYCPRCKDTLLKKAIYKRTEGKSERLYGCPECLFLIRRSDVMGDPACDAIVGVPK